MSRHGAHHPRSVVGKRMPLVDARRKVTGSGVYTEDIYLPNMLVARILRSTQHHARIISIDTTEAIEVPGVAAVITGAEYPNKFGVIPISKDETALATEKVVYVGDVVCAIAGSDLYAVEEALAKVKVAYEPLPAYHKPEESLEEVPEKIHPLGIGKTNIHRMVDQDFGDIEQAKRSAAITARGRFTFQGVTHGFTEPHAVVARYEVDGRLTVWTATQVPHYVHRALSEVLGIQMHRIRVVKPMVGGGFGGKSDPFPHEMAAAILSMRTGRPVKLVFDREEVFLTNHGRHPTSTRMEMTASEDGKLTGLDIEALIDGGAWSSFGVISTYYNGVLSVAPYDIPNFRYKGRRVFTNKPPSGAMRGHGAVNSRFAAETLVDMIANELGIDPIQLRLRNLIPPYTDTVNHFRITSNGIAECLEVVRKASDWDSRHGNLPYGEGLGIGCGFYISGSALPIHWDPARFPQSTVHIKIDMDGGVTVHTGAAEIGQGSDTVAAQVVAEVLGLPTSMIHVKAQDTDLAPVDLGSYSSRVTFMMGNAARRAAEQVRDELTAAAARLTGYAAELFTLEDGTAHCRSRPAVQVPYMRVLHEAIADRGALVAKGCYRSPPMGGSFKGAAAGLAPAYSFSAYVAHVRVEPQSGFVHCDKVWAAHDCGKALNPLAVEGQIEGSIHMGLGQVLSEGMRYHKGQLLNPSLLDYKIPTPFEMPDVEVFIVESDDPEGPFGAKEAGEGPLLPILPAVGNAIFDAVGVRVFDLPITPDRLLKAIEEQGAADATATSSKQGSTATGRTKRGYVAGGATDEPGPALSRNQR